jgi:hypothetical protein
MTTQGYCPQTHSHTDRYTNTHTHTERDKHTQIYTHPYRYTHTYTQTQLRKHTYTHRDTHTHTYTHIHTHIHTYNPTTYPYYSAVSVEAWRIPSKQTWEMPPPNLLRRSHGSSSSALFVSLDHDTRLYTYIHTDTMSSKPTIV